jgi:2-phosphosulfolactate phosphatase
LIVDVALTPAYAADWQDRICIVVDVLRASSTIVTVLEGGADRVIAAASLDEARQLARPGDILVGEHDGIAPSDFDFGNSPFKLALHDLEERTVVLATSNGTVVLNHLKDAPHVFAGSFLNARAVCQAALEEARNRGLNIGIVCAGNFGLFALDDAVCVGYLTGEVMRQAKELRLNVQVTESAEAAYQLFRSYPDILTPFSRSASGVRIIEIGDPEDGEFCARIDASQVVPVLVPGFPLYLKKR